MHAAVGPATAISYYGPCSHSLSKTERLVLFVRLLMNSPAYLPPVPGTEGSATIVIITITIEEFPIVQKAFGLTRNLPGTKYFVKDPKKRHHPVVLMRALDQTTLPSQEAVYGVIEDFRPAFVFLIGTAGGHSERDNICLGDVVVATYVDFSDYVKYSRKQVLQRKFAHDHPSKFLLDRFVEPLRCVPEEWNTKVKGRPKERKKKLPKLLTGEIVSGNRLLGDSERPEQMKIMAMFDKALAFEMEAMGVARAMYASRPSIHYNPQYLVVRGISDYVDKHSSKNQKLRKEWTPYAVKTATTVAARIIERLLKFSNNLQPRVRASAKHK